MKTIKVQDKIWKKLKEEQATFSFKKGKVITISETIECLFELISNLNEDWEKMNNKLEEQGIEW